MKLTNRWEQSERKWKKNRQSSRYTSLIVIFPIIYNILGKNSLMILIILEKAPSGDGGRFGTALESRISPGLIQVLVRDINTTDDLKSRIENEIDRNFFKFNGRDIFDDSNIRREEDRFLWLLDPMHSIYAAAYLIKSRKDSLRTRIPTNNSNIDPIMLIPVYGGLGEFQNHYPDESFGFISLLTDGSRNVNKRKKWHHTYLITMLRLDYLKNTNYFREQMHYLNLESDILAGKTILPNRLECIKIISR